MGYWTFSALLLPCLWAAGKETISLFPLVGAAGWRSWWLYAAGAAAYLAMERFLHKPMWFYIIGHELTHAAAGLLSGARIHAIKTTAKHGEVRMSKSNAFVALSPYIVPFYLIFILALYGLVARWWTDPAVVKTFQFFVGFTLAFHVSLTFQAFHRRQPDLKYLGFVLSAVVILLGNTLIVGLLTVSLFKTTPTVGGYTSAIAAETVAVWREAGWYAGKEARYWARSSTGQNKKSTTVRLWTP